MGPLKRVGLDLQDEERAAIEEQAKLLEFDRQNHLGVSDRSAKHLTSEIHKEAALMFDRKRVLAGAVNIGQNADSMKV